jgi:histidyl-tRNA synthetase
MKDLSVRGTRDLYPEGYARIAHIFGVWRDAARAYGFEEFDSPILETLKLYTLKSGDEIVSQLYNFPDKGGRMLALRPELTPSLARMVARIHNEAPKPIKWFSIPRCMRYEKPQKGRLREFFQWNVDIIGEQAETADLEIISVAVDALVKLGLTERDFVVKINNRDFVSSCFESLGIDGTREKALYKIIDNARKRPGEHTEEALGTLGLADEARRGIDEYMALRSMADLEAAPRGGEGRESLLRLFTLIEAAGIADFCQFDPFIVRGLDYYTGIVFEIFDKSERMRAICGGGRYNNLVREFSGIEIPACGFGMGDVVLGEILEGKGLLPPYSRGIDYYLVRVSEDELPLLLKVARFLRGRGEVVEFSYGSMPLKRQMARASRLGARKALIFGEQEIAEGRLVEKSLDTGDERTIPIPGSG